MNALPDNLRYSSPAPNLGCQEDEGADMATNVVNLDALIPREDFAVLPSRDWKKSDTLRITDLGPKDFFYSALRKPDFQRETANWSPGKIQDFVKTFLEGDLIPAIIFWNAGETVFVIDGAHRLSALIAWVHDDYGDGAKSREFFQNYIPVEQSRAADRTRKLIKETIGTYIEHLAAVEHPERSRPELVDRAKRLGSLALQLQWVPAGDAKKAEASFFKINQEATQIDPTELRILRGRTSPNALAARVIVRNATGHKYWSAFPNQTQSDMENLGKEIYSTLFHPPLDTPIKTLDLPVAGRGYSGQTLPLIFDLVNLANDLPVIDAPKRQKSSDAPIIDEDGSKTSAYLIQTRALVRRISGTHPSSLGMHPAIYFYSSTGRYQPTAFLAGASFVNDLVKNNELVAFTKVRKDFEEFLLLHKDFVNQIQTKIGSGRRGLDWIKEVYEAIFAALKAGKKSKQVLKALQSEEKFAFLLTRRVEESAEQSGKDFNRNTKSAAFIRDALDSALRCAICGAFLHRNSMHIDHIVRKQDGGEGKVDNAQLSHPYCDSTVKN